MISLSRTTNRTFIRCPKVVWWTSLPTSPGRAGDGQPEQQVVTAVYTQREFTHE